ncbi:probable polygalacturonase At3g15720 isoform X3 [Nicotiana tomentosiformis]|uniref:probable polygalacturonase At3g15720 isoform X3 n=1 Tax=Nicotiana tomentosiformis TaxID=4098 RepID=UPI0008789D81|nr:probable polygalacturonase At3g15720 isoform X3 [Nicotiana tomentosiformis]
MVCWRTRDRAFIFVICITPFILDKSLAAIFDVTSYGAVGDGMHDDTKAFKQAWTATCSSKSRNPSMLIPSEKSFLIRPITFQGPCKSSNIHLQLSGSIVAPEDPKEWRGCENVSWIYFTGVFGLFINGSGTINGNGQRWWKIPSGIRVNGTCTKPTAVHFNYCNGLQLSGIKLVNSSRNHISLTYSKGVTISNIHISAPKYSRNTDGIDISNSSQLHIQDSTIQTGDDCIAINTGCVDIHISGISCGPGHGISVGSLGPDNTYAYVDNVYVTNCNLVGTQNGVRIKTWQGGSGYARSIHFEDIHLKNVENPIIIDQNYCNGDHSCQPQESAVKVSYITYKNIHGSTSSKAAINLNCSNSTACTNIDMENINITPVVSGQKVFAICNNAKGKASSTSPPVPCLDKY